MDIFWNVSVFCSYTPSSLQQYPQTDDGEQPGDDNQCKSLLKPVSEA